MQDLKEERRNTSNLTTVNGRVISMNLRRWHKIYLGFSGFLGAATSIHEFTHVNNYWLDEGEEKLHREQTAVAFEILHLAKLNSIDWVLANYLTNMAGVVANPQDLLATEYKGMPPLRTLVYGLLKRVWDGTYHVSGDKMEAIETWAATYLEDGNKGDRGLNRAFVSAKLKTNSGNILTATQWRADVYQSLGRRAKPNLFKLTNDELLSEIARKVTADSFFSANSETKMLLRVAGHRNLKKAITLANGYDRSLGERRILFFKLRDKNYLKRVIEDPNLFINKMKTKLDSSTQNEKLPIALATYAVRNASEEALNGKYGLSKAGHKMHKAYEKSFDG
ncbi:MAG: hypothetical protein HYV97_02690 [Bdellovibrio sp.]|nr:hypothetical protein [Bdellovibrio sp.]